MYNWTLNRYTNYCADLNICSYRNGDTFVFVSDSQSHRLEDAQTNRLTDS